MANGSVTVNNSQSNGSYMNANDVIVGKNAVLICTNGSGETYIPPVVSVHNPNISFQSGARTTGGDHLSFKLGSVSNVRRASFDRVEGYQTERYRTETLDSVSTGVTVTDITSDIIVTGKLPPADWGWYGDTSTGSLIPTWLLPPAPTVTVTNDNGAYMAAITRQGGSYPVAPISYSAEIPVMGQYPEPIDMSFTPETNGRITGITGITIPAADVPNAGGLGAQFVAQLTGQNLTPEVVNRDLHWIVSTGRDPMGQYPRKLASITFTDGKLIIDASEGLPGGITLYATAYVGPTLEEATIYKDVPFVTATVPNSRVSESWMRWMEEQNLPLPEQPSESSAPEASSSEASSSEASSSEASSSEASSSEASSSEASSSEMSSSETASLSASSETASAPSVTTGAVSVSNSAMAPVNSGACGVSPKITTQVLAAITTNPTSGTTWSRDTEDGSQTYRATITTPMPSSDAHYYYAKRAGRNDTQPLTPANSIECAGEGFNEIAGLKAGDFVAVHMRYSPVLPTDSHPVRDSDTILFAIKSAGNDTLAAERLTPGVPRDAVRENTFKLTGLESEVGEPLRAWESWGPANKILTININEMRKNAKLSDWTDANGNAIIDEQLTQLKDVTRYPVPPMAALKVEAKIKVDLQYGGDSSSTESGSGEGGSTGVARVTSPTIFPYQPGQQAVDNKVTIKRGNESDQVYFTILYRDNPGEGQTWGDYLSPGAAVTPPQDLVEGTTYSYSYSPDIGIPFPEGQSVMTVVAMSCRVGAVDSESTWVTYRDTSRPAGERFHPRIGAWSTAEGGSFTDYNSTAYYDYKELKEKGIFLFHEKVDKEGASFLYTINGGDPTQPGSNPKTGGKGRLEIPTVASGAELVVRAVYQRSNYVPVKETFVFKIKQAYSAPEMYIDDLNDATEDERVPNDNNIFLTVPNGTKVYFKLKNDDIPLRMRPLNDLIVLDASDVVYENLVPKIHYTMNTTSSSGLPPETPTGTSPTYTLGHAPIKVNGDTRPKVDPASIEIKGNAKQYVWIKVIVKAGDDVNPNRLSTDTVFNYQFQIKSQVSPPAFSPSGAESSSGAATAPIRLNEWITMTVSGTEAPLDKKIYYTLDGTEPFNDAGQLAPSAKTIAAGEKAQIELEKFKDKIGSTLTVKAVLEDTSGTLSNSETTTRFYTIKDRQQSTAPVIETPGTPEEPKQILGGAQIKITAQRETGSTVDQTIKVRSAYVEPNALTIPTDTPEITYDPATPITLSQEQDMKDKVLMVEAWVDNGPASDYSKSDVVTGYFSRKRVSAPTVIPNASETNPVQITNNSNISFTTPTAEALYVPKYYYCTGYNAVPEMNEENVYFPDTPIRVNVGGMETYFYLNVLAVPTTGTEQVRESKVYRFVYTVQQLPEAEPPVASPSTTDTAPTSLKRGAKIYLTSKTANNTLYYTTDGSAPNTAEYAKNPDAGSTKKYIPQNGILMTPNEGEELFFIMAVTQEGSDPPKNSESPMMRATYKLAKATTPTSGPATTPDNIAQVAPGSTITLMSDGGVPIYYTLDGTTPIPPNSDNGQPSGSTELYKDPIKVGNASGNQLYIRAIASPERTVDVAGTKLQAMQNSDVAYFTYQIKSQNPAPAPVISPSTSDIAPANLARGDKITMTASILSSRIYYTTDSSLPDPDARDAWDAALKDYLSANSGKTPADFIDAGHPEPATKIYNLQTGLKMDPEGSDELFIVQAIVRDLSPQRTYSDSGITRATYRLAQAAPPTAEPATTDASPTHITKTSLITLIAPTGYVVRYTTDGSVPTDTSTEFVAAFNPTAEMGQKQVIKAITVAAEDANGKKPVLNSAVAVFTYLVDDLPMAPAPTSDPPTSDTNPALLSRGDLIALSADVNANIYYTVSERGMLRPPAPDPDQYIAELDNFIDNGGRYAAAEPKSAEQRTRYASQFAQAQAEIPGSTRLYTGPIPMAPVDENPFYVRAVARDSSEMRQHADSPSVSFVYRLAQIAPPTAYPATTLEKPTNISINDTVSLYVASGSVDATIYYAVDSYPRLNAAGEPAAETTKEYTDLGILIDRKYAGKNITINAIAVPKPIPGADGIPGEKPARTSENISYLYHVSELPRAAVPVVSPATDNANPTALQRGNKLSLATSTVTAQIYYTTNGETPNPIARIMWDKDFAAYVAGKTSETVTDIERENYRAIFLSERDATPEPSTKLYTTRGVTMNPEGGGDTFVLQAVAAARDKLSAEPTTHLDSEIIRATYQLAKASPPTATPATTGEQVATLAPGGKIVLTSRESGVEIYYRTDDLPPDPLDTANIDLTAGGTDSTKPIKRYNSQTGVVMPENIGTFFNIMAVVHDARGNYSDSTPVRFSYQAPAPVQAVNASPGAGTVVKGTQVTLSCTTEKAKIFYEMSVGGTAAEPKANSSPSYSSPITINENTSIKALAEKDGVISAVTAYEYKVASKVTEITPSIASGSVVANGTPLKFKTESGATVIYTKDNSDPTKTDNKNLLYGTELVLSGEEGKPVTIRAYATKGGLTPSDTLTLTYTIAKSDALVTASPVSGTTLKKGDTVTLTTPVTGALIYYSTDGSTPTKTGSFNQYDEDIFEPVRASDKRGSQTANIILKGEPGSTVTIKALATTGSDNAVPVVFTYPLVPKTPSPTASIPSGAITLAGAKVTLTVKDASIYYTTDGTDPTTSSTLYTTPIEADQSMVLKAIAKAETMEASDIVTYTYTRAGQAAAPVPSIPSGEIETGSLVSIVSETQGATIYYSTDGTEPEADNTGELFQYTGPISITRPVTLKLIAVEKGLHPSPVNVAAYTVKEPYVPPVAEETNEEERAVTSTDRLMSRRAYSVEAEGPTYTDKILRDNPTGTLVGAKGQTLPEETRLEAMVRQPAENEELSVQSTLSGYSIAALYDLTLTNAGETVQPDGNVEIGLPIPENRVNGIVIVCRVNDDGTVTAFPTRRSGNMAYVIVDHFSKYAVAAPVLPEPTKTDWRVILAIGGMGAALLLVLTLTLCRRRNGKAKK